MLGTKKITDLNQINETLKSKLMFKPLIVDLSQGNIKINSYVQNCVINFDIYEGEKKLMLVDAESDNLDLIIKFNKISLTVSEDTFTFQLDDVVLNLEVKDGF